MGFFSWTTIFEYWRACINDLGTTNPKYSPDLALDLRLHPEIYTQPSAAENPLTRKKTAGYRYNLSPSALMHRIPCHDPSALWTKIEENRLIQLRSLNYPPERPMRSSGQLTYIQVQNVQSPIRRLVVLERRILAWVPGKVEHSPMS